MAHKLHELAIHCESNEYQRDVMDQVNHDQDINDDQKVFYEKLLEELQKVSYDEKQDRGDWEWYRKLRTEFEENMLRLVEEKTREIVVMRVGSALAL